MAKKRRKETEIEQVDSEIVEDDKPDAIMPYN